MASDRVAELVERCVKVNATFTYAEHTGDRDQLVFDVRAIVDGVRLGLSAHVPADELEAREGVELALLEAALEGLEQGAAHWTAVTHKKIFMTPRQLVAHFARRPS
jgi:hypothetical protein